MTEQPTASPAPPVPPPAEPPQHPDHGPLGTVASWFHHEPAAAPSPMT